METTTLALRVRFLRGIYQGHSPDKSPELMPQPARLHSALLNSAGRGTAAIRTAKGFLRPSEESITALKWLEQHAPDGIEVPEHRWLDPAHRRFIYRNVSSVNFKHRTEERAISDGVTVASHFGFMWNNVPVRIASTIEDLTGDIAYIGEAESIAVVEPGEVTPTLVLDKTSSPFKRGGLGLECPSPGRTAYLLNQFENLRKQKPPKTEKYSKSELPVAPPVPREFITRHRYAGVKQQPTTGPWMHVVFLGLPGAEVPIHLRVELAKVVHRAIVAAVGYGTSPMITGKYPKSLSNRPANHLAVHYLPRVEAKRFGYDHGVVMLLIPRSAEELDLKQLTTALPSVAKNGLWSRRLGKRKVTFNGHSVPATDFWPEPETGMKRLWFTATPVVPDTRPVSEQKLGRRWNLRDAGLLSVAFTFKDDLEFSGRHETLYLNARDTAHQLGCRILKAKTVAGKPRDYAHTMPKSVSIQPWSGIVDLGGLHPETGMVAIGQSRHMGGGLLVPHDVKLEEYTRLMEGMRDV
ncbi:hypothetical protein HMPREF2787_10560 [Corynebacterium sp. HMSC061H03]|uniref:type I-G CRISPR-associated protein Csb2 n=1 Tax=Corynebacterium sp. HMSC061H03 TaxID=1739291 RepID=UPI00091685A9|nr:type I-U CRISPR-associated protein Csb2 [Corynebacterium sp. HMSC061H03]OHR23863.1 hypothetical protein HMPREF2787_10560 [Corynebacterium sp. HMSC061H03]